MNLWIIILFEIWMHLEILAVVEWSSVEINWRGSWGFEFWNSLPAKILYDDNYSDILVKK